MLQRRFASLALVGVVGALVLTLTACHPSSNIQRCDDQLGAQQEITASLGGWLRCDPSYDPDEPSNAVFVVQWDRDKPTSWLWDKRLDTHDLNFYAWVGVYELYAYHQGRIPDFYLYTQKWGVPDSITQEAYNWAAQQTG